MLVVVLAVLTTVLASAPPAGAQTVPGLWDVTGLGCVSRPAPQPALGATMVSEPLGPVPGGARLQTFLVHSRLQGPTHVNVLLPPGFDSSGAVRYPVLYLLHGANGSYADWAGSGDVQARAGPIPLIIVMPDDGAAGSYSDWYGVSRLDQLTAGLAGLLGGTGASQSPGSPGVAPSWESFHIEELIPWVDATFPTRPSPAARAIAGVSSGGAGAVKYAAAHPGLFGFAGSFSGALDNDLVDATTNWYQDASSLAGGVPDQRCTFGDPFVSDQPNQAYAWHDNDPTELAPNLAGTRLWVAAGNGQPSPADLLTPAGTLAGQQILEQVVNDMSHHFVSALDAAGLGGQLTTQFSESGVHAWAYWQQDLSAFLSWLAPQLNRPLPVPRSFSFRSARQDSAAWGWTFTHSSGLSVRNVNTAEEFLYLTGVSRRGFTAAGHGMLEVGTAPGLYRPGSGHTVRVGAAFTRVRADRSGRLRFPVWLGPLASASQALFPPGGPPAGTPTVRVSIS